MKQNKKKYISVANNKIYEITKISFFYMTVEAVETNLTFDDVQESDVWDFGEFKNYSKVTFVNKSGQGKTVDLKTWKEKHSLEK